MESESPSQDQSRPSPRRRNRRGRGGVGWNGVVRVREFVSERFGVSSSICVDDVEVDVDEIREVEGLL